MREDSLYLGLPSFVNRKKSATFGYIKEKLQDKLQGWDKKHLSRAGKEILIKSVAQTLPNYTMNVFLLPVEVCKDLEKTMCKFWWNSDPKKLRSIHWMSWDRLGAKKSDGGMGFRNIRDFNIALLGKQAWRLLTHPDKLVSQIFKARYYPSGSFLTSQLGSNPSYIWRSVLAAQDLVKQGSACRIGNGESVFILNTPWLPDQNDPYVHSSHEALIGQTVASLMVTGASGWEVDILNDLFTERDVNLILSIPLEDGVEDNWYWRYEKLGSYSVKSAYTMLQAAKRVNHDNDNSGFWRKLWNLKIPPKVQNFLWRAATNCLPTKDLLRIKQVQVNSLCSICNAAPESILHILIECPFAKHCWNAAYIPDIAGDPRSFGEWLKLVFDQRDAKTIHISSVICWMLWKNRNDLVWNQTSMDVQELLHTALSTLNQWRYTQDKTFDHTLGFLNPEDGRTTWQAPSMNKVKVNTDAALFDNPTRYSHAQVVRDHNGKLMEARSQCYLGSASPELAEAMGIREALSWVKDTRKKDVVIESDCLTMIQWIRSSFITMSYIGRVVEDCRRLLIGLQESNVMLRFVKRSANSVAHYLARYSSSIADRTWRLENVHPEFDYVLCNDLI